MFGARRYRCATASLLAHLAFAAIARGGDSPSTVIVSSNVSDARLTRALVLIRGELSALGIDVQVRVADTADAPPFAPETTSDRLSLDVKEGVIVVRVFAAGAQAPLVESVDLDGPDVTAEVIAVRAVEALRAARLLPPETQPAAAPAPAKKKPRTAHSSVGQPLTEQPQAAPPSTTPIAPSIPMLQVALGATFVQNSQGLPQPGAQAAIRIGPHWGFVAVGAEASLAGLSFERPVGSAQVSRRTLFLQLGARVRLHRAWELNARGGVNYLHYSAEGTAESGYLARDLEHGTGALSLSVGGAYYFLDAFGVYLDVGGLVAFDAARLRLGNEDVVALDRPSLACGAGVLLGAF